MSAAFNRMASITASTRRPPAIIGGKRGEAVALLDGVKCWPLQSLDSETQRRFNLQSPLETKQTFVDGDLDICEGDQLVIGAHVYPIRNVEAFPFLGSVRLRLILEDMK